MSLRIPEAEYAALCRKVLERDGWKCQNPRCGYRESLHVHHIIYRSQQGKDESWNLITVCNQCHDRIHDYKLFIFVAEGNWVGEGGGADGRVLFKEEEQ